MIVAIEHGGRYALVSFLLCRVNDVGEWDKYNDEETVLFQTDWDFPSLASCFGYVPCENCDTTDGTIDCAHKTASEMIANAYDYLSALSGEAIETDTVAEYFQVG